MNLITKIFKLFFPPKEKLEMPQINYMCTRHRGELCPDYANICVDCDILPTLKGGEDVTF